MKLRLGVADGLQCRRVLRLGLGQTAPEFFDFVAEMLFAGRRRRGQVEMACRTRERPGHRGAAGWGRASRSRIGSCYLTHLARPGNRRYTSYSPLSHGGEKVM